MGLIFYLIFYSIFLGLGFFQLFAIADGIDFFFGTEGTFLALFLAIISTYFPIIGPVLGVYGAYNVWGWNLIPSILLFFTPTILFVSMLIISGSASVFSKNR